MGPPACVLPASAQEQQTWQQPMLPAAACTSLLLLLPLQALVSECVWYFNTGSICRPEVSAGATAWAANPTLLQPGSRRWSIHYGALPFLSFIPLDPARHAGLLTSKGPRALTQVGAGKRVDEAWGWGSAWQRGTLAGTCGHLQQTTVLLLHVDPSHLSPLLCPAGLPVGAAPAAAGLARLPSRCAGGGSLLVLRCHGTLLWASGRAGAAAGGEGSDGCRNECTSTGRAAAPGAASGRQAVASWRRL